MAMVVPVVLSKLSTRLKLLLRTVTDFDNTNPTTHIYPKFIVIRENFMRIKIAIFAAILLFASLATTAVLADDFSDAVGSYLVKEFSLKVKSVKIIERTQTHVLKEILLENKRLGVVRLYKRDPAASQLAQWPTAFVLSGLGTSLTTMNLIPDSGLADASFVVYSYAFDRAPENADEIPEFIKSVPLSVLQIAAAYLWLEQQSDVLPDKIVSLNVSYGTFLAPPALRLLADIKHYPAQTIFAFGGADLEPFITEYVKGKDAKRITSDIVRQINMKPNFKRLRGPFLVIDGTSDKVIPKASSDALYNYLNDPKTRVELETDHIGTRKPEVIQQMLNVVYKWLEQFP
jgi:hypothetical protein